MRSAATVVVLAGGRSRRFGRDKLLAEFRGQPLLAHVLGQIPPQHPILVVGDMRSGTVDLDHRVQWVREDPLFGGPLSALAAALPRIDTEFFVLIAGDMPHAPEAIAALLASCPSGGRAQGAGPDGRVQPLLAAYDTKAARGAMPPDPVGCPMRALELPTVRVDVPARITRDVDTTDDLTELH